ncbi:hypothetical protein CELL_01812 [Cellulomonas sp. T2.31MG-18]|uniref:hypothetical protein n=1 Tax=Cellulomonas sp. T2.31MG-18 TaxID=3157619 RepID=UPI0035E88EA5
MKTRLLALALVSIGLLAACTASPAGPGVPTLAASGSTAGSNGAGSSGAARAAALHAAAQCIREHGVPAYQDPVLDAEGHVYTDSRSIADADQATGNRSGIENQLRDACEALITAAGLQPTDQPPAPPALVQAGVAAAQCLRANGLPNVTDPTSATPYTPGHGFGLTSAELPQTGAGKADPTVQRAFAACRDKLDAEVAQSTFTALAHD